MDSRDIPESTGHQLAAGRHRLILAALEQSDELTVAQLVADLGVSAETIRRDLRVLEGRGRLKRVHGGVVALRNAELETYDQRSAHLRDEKRRMAEMFAALDLVGPGKRIFIGGGSTMLPIAQELAQAEGAQFLTNAIDIAATLHRGGQHRVELTGGELTRNYEVLTGPDMTESAARFRYDLAITSTNAIDAELGFLEFFRSEADLHRILSRQSRSYVIVADHSKFGGTAEFVTFGHGAVDLVLTDREPAAEFRRAFARAGVEVQWPDAGAPAAPSRHA